MRTTMLYLGMTAALLLAACVDDKRDKVVVDEVFPENGATGVEPTVHISFALSLTGQHQGNKSIDKKTLYAPGAVTLATGGKIVEGSLQDNIGHFGETIFIPNSP